MENRKKISITGHAKLRLSQRVPSVKSCDYYSFARSARYNGKTLHDLRCEDPKIASYVRQNFKTSNSSQIRYYRGCVFVFSGNNGKARTLVTVVNLEDEAI